MGLVDLLALVDLLLRLYRRFHQPLLVLVGLEVLLALVDLLLRLFHRFHQPLLVLVDLVVPQVR
ncbi:hypothetical protein D3C87_1979760 [compost metagenome]